MSEMSSFYGGRQGNSIVIAKRFDGIDIPQVAGSYVYTRALYAVDTDGKFIVTTDSTISGVVGVSTDGGATQSTTIFVIKKNKENYLGTDIPNFAAWGGHDNDGSLVVDGESYVFYPELAQGMVQFFEQGAKTASEVNYGAYVIIDTILNMATPNDPDNGKVYRRGMDINSTDGLAGAEYIGQIVGSQGESTEIDVQTYDNVTALSPHSERVYNATNDSIVPGSYTIGSTRFYEEEIRYAFATIRDAFGNVEGCQIGFKFPTLVEDYEARSLSPYEQRKTDGDGKYYNYDLITQDSSEYVDMTKTFALNSDSQFVLGSSTEVGAYEVVATEGTIYLIEKTDDTETLYPSWQTVSFNGETSITGSDAATYHLPQIKKWSHPFYQKWQISVPHGYHGINPEDIEIIHTYTKTPKYKGGSITIYNTAECSDEDIYKIVTDENETYRLYGTSYVNVKSKNDLDEDDTDARGHFEKVNGKCYMRYGSGYDADEDVVYAMIKLNDDVFKYVRKEDCYLDILRYCETDFDDEESGIKRYFYLGDYNTIDRVTISEDGTLSVFYTAKEQPQDYEQVLRWIDTKNTDGITIDEDGTVHVYYNTLDGEGKHEHQDYPTVLDWITEASLTARGKFTVLYNNDTMIVGHDEKGNPIYGDKYETTLQWIDYVDISDDGTVTFRWNTDGIHNTTPEPDENPAYRFNNQIKYLVDVDVQNTAIDVDDKAKRKDGREGSGDQKIHLQFNNDGRKDTPIGEPLNYIIETCICKPSTSYPNVPYSHLLVYYADPELRKTLGHAVIDEETGKITSSDWITYPSSKYDGVFWTEWVDLGDTRGENGGVHILKNVTSLDELKDSEGNYIPPEKLTDDNGVVINSEGAGWSCTCDIEGESSSKYILFYDYNIKEWYSIGRIDSASTDPAYTIVKSKPESEYTPSSKDVSILKANGIWLAAETAIYVY